MKTPMKYKPTTIYKCFDFVLGFIWGLLGLIILISWCPVYFCHWMFKTARYKESLRNGQPCSQQPLLTTFMIDLKCKSCGEEDYRIPHEGVMMLHLECPLCEHRVSQPELSSTIFQMISESLNNAIENGYEMDLENWTPTKVAQDLTRLDTQFENVPPSALEPFIRNWKIDAKRNKQ